MGILGTVKELWRSDRSWYSQLESCRWLHIISDCLSVVHKVVTAIAVSQQTVILQGPFLCSSDSLVCALSYVSSLFFNQPRVAVSGCLYFRSSDDDGDHNNNKEQSCQPSVDIICGHPPSCTYSSTALCATRSLAIIFDLSN